MRKLIVEAIDCYYADLFTSDWLSLTTIPYKIRS